MHTVTDRTFDILSRHHALVLTLLALVLFLLVVGVGDVAAHNPAGIGVPGCENGADVVGHKNPNCHG